MHDGWSLLVKVVQTQGHTIIIKYGGADLCGHIYSTVCIDTSGHRYCL